MRGPAQQRVLHDGRGGRLQRHAIRRGGAAEVRHDSLSFDLLHSIAGMRDSRVEVIHVFFLISFPLARSTYGTDKWYRQVMHG